MTPKELVWQAIHKAAYKHGVKPQALLTMSRERSVAYARWQAAYELRSVRNMDGSFRFPLRKIAAFVGLKDHASIIYGIARHAVMNGLPPLERRQDTPSIAPQIMVESSADGRGALTPRPPSHQRPAQEVRQCREAI